MKRLTRKQQAVLDFLSTYLRRHGYPPTVREIGARFGILWSAARGHLKSLERKGYVRVNPLISRGIEILREGAAESILIPVAGRIRAGRPMLAAEDVDAHILIDRSLFPEEDSFSLRVTGESMIDAGIFDGDFVIVRPQEHTENGEICAVLIGDEATVKRVFVDDGKITLKPENRNMEPMTCEAESLRIVGKVIGVIRKIA